MRCLEITFIPPDRKSGGGLGVYQSIRSLSEICDVDYIGPDYDKELFENSHKYVNKLKVLNMASSRGIRFIYRLLFHNITTLFYDSWLEAEKTIVWDNYDFVHIESSRYVFLLNEVQKNHKKCIVRVHNIESDYAYNLYKISRKFSDYIRFIVFKHNEKAVLKKADRAIMITKSDSIRAHEQYAIDTDRLKLNPICIDIRENVGKNEINEKGKKNNYKTILMTGSLDYEPNVEGIIWFVKNVWKVIEQSKMDKDLRLVIAGRKPGKKLFELLKLYKKAIIINSPLTMEKYFYDADIYVASVFDGAGMKVKVAEAMSYGLPVVGTQHAFIGYESINYGKYLANKAEEFIEAIATLADIDDYHVMRKKILSDFKNSLSMDSSILRYKEIIKDVLQ